MKKRNVVAQDLRTSKYKPRIVKSKKQYSRKNKSDKIEKGICKEFLISLHIPFLGVNNNANFG